MGEYVNMVVHEVLGSMLTWWYRKYGGVPYSWKIWRELYLAIWSPNPEIKYWRNLNLAICDCEAKFHCVILACG